MEPGTSKRKKLKRRYGAAYKPARKHGDLKDYKTGEKNMTPTSEMDGRENNADREMRRMIQGHTSKMAHNAEHSKRRYK